jgi:phospholipid/cholesterol/gamma-HCH transport system ATP-binding protein
MIEVRQLHKSFGAQEVLAGVDLSVATGEAAIIIGRSGCGKSILLKHLIGLLQPDRGDVLVDGRSIARLNERALLQVRRKFGMLFQGAALFDSLTVYENIAFPLRRHGRWTEVEIREKVEDALEMVALAGAGPKKPSELSGGMRKRVGLARAIVYRPQFVLYDEPTTGLDPVVSDSIDHLIVRVCERLKVTTVVVTHDMRSVRTIGQKVFMLHEGRIYATGTPQDFFQSRDPVVYRFVNGISDPKDLAL